MNSTDPLGLKKCKQGHSCPKPKAKPKAKSKPKAKRVLASSPYSGPSVRQAGPTEVIPAGALVFTITSSVTVYGSGADPDVSIGTDGSIEVEGPGYSTSVSPEGAELGLVGPSGVSVCTDGGGGLCYTAPPVEVGLNAEITITAELGPPKPPSPGEALKELGLTAGITALGVGCGLASIATDSDECPTFAPARG